MVGPLLMNRTLLRAREPTDARSRLAMLHAYFEYSRYSLVFALLLITMQVVYIAGRVPWSLLLAWLLGSVLMLATRWHWRARFLAQSAARTMAELDAWRWRAVAGAGGAGLMWAVALLMDFEPGDVTSQMFCATIACLTCVGSINVMAPVPRAFHALLLPVITTLTLQFLSLATRDNFSGFYLAGLTLVAAVMANGLARNHSKLLHESHEMRFEREAIMLQLEEANAAKSRFLAAASHDLRQPLHALGLLASQVRDEVEGRRAAQTAERIETIVGSLDKLVDALMDISRLDSGRIEMHVAPLPLAPVFERLAGEFAALAEDRDLQWRLRPTGLWVHSDPVLLERMLRNLLGNALRYTESGGVLLAAQRRSHPDGDRVRIGIWDTGIGIAPEHQQKVFDEFVQLHNPGRLRELGLGLGLSIVARLAKLLEHRVGVRSRLGRGSCFSIELPLAPALPAAAPAAVLAGPLGEPLAGLGVALVEDDDAVRDSTVGLLQRWGCHVWAAPSAPQLQALLGAPDRLICDWRLAEGDGMQAITSLRRWLGTEVPALLLSGETVPAAVLEAARQAGVEVARKPLPPAALRAWLGSPLARGEALQ
ncbi:hybrid sensor histidine kinase/response regulator [Aquincola sp. S2]|uniref:histidine kinase n=1 Tax=Pseudaquabacterium terrae TaxID=2732868 RepID=A0ABX2EC92_9BURK|nr:hybrid sensor histidine kinase/response regulator [Aquabacterium terrae]NRF65387.1 hybrid sensor histidine kinase/response regulator [Aquabacterium terrae]